MPLYRVPLAPIFSVGGAPVPDALSGVGDEGSVAETIERRRQAFRFADCYLEHTISRKNHQLSE